MSARGLAIVLLAAMSGASANGIAQNASGRDGHRPAHHTTDAITCSAAVSDSRMLCLSGGRCVREISRILHSCSKPGHAACAAAREDLRSYCGRESDWYGTRECNIAVGQIPARCGG
jgi:hypothetical protein